MTVFSVTKGGHYLRQCFEDGEVCGMKLAELVKEHHFDVCILQEQSTYPVRMPEQFVADARKIGYTTTLYGRRRYIPELTSSNFNIRQGAERIALNTPIQGTAADLIKMAMIRVYHALKENYPQAKLILQVHDELIVECPAALAQEVADLVSREMEQVAALNVPLTAEAKWGSSWLEAK